MGMTIAEKIIAKAAGVDAVKAGDIHTVTLDRMGDDRLSVFQGTHSPQ